MTELLKMHPKALAAHFKKAAAHHEKMSDHHEKCMKAHEAHAEHHEAMDNDHDADDANKVEKAHKSHHKASAQFHKTMAKHHEHLHKSHSSHAEHLHKMCAACEAGADTKKIAQLLEIEEGELGMEKTEVTLQTPPAVASTTPTGTPAAVQSTVPGAGIDVNETINKALDNKLTEAVDSAFSRVLNSEDFNRKVDQAIAGKLLEKLGQTTVPGEIKTFAVPRPGEGGFGKVNTQIKPDFTGVDPELAHFAAID